MLIAKNLLTREASYKVFGMHIRQFANNPRSKCPDCRNRGCLQLSKSKFANCSIAAIASRSTCVRCRDEILQAFMTATLTLYPMTLIAGRMSCAFRTSRTSSSVRTAVSAALQAGLRTVLTRHRDLDLVVAGHSSFYPDVQ